MEVSFFFKLSCNLPILPWITMWSMYWAPLGKTITFKMTFQNDMTGLWEQHSLAWRNIPPLVHYLLSERADITGGREAAAPSTRKPNSARLINYSRTMPTMFINQLNGLSHLLQCLLGKLQGYQLEPLFTDISVRSFPLCSLSPTPLLFLLCVFHVCFQAGRGCILVHAHRTIYTPGTHLQLIIYTCLLLKVLLPIPSWPVCCLEFFNFGSLWDSQPVLTESFLALLVFSIQLPHCQQSPFWSNLLRAMLSAAINSFAPFPINILVLMQWLSRGVTLPPSATDPIEVCFPSASHPISGWSLPCTRCQFIGKLYWYWLIYNLHWPDDSLYTLAHLCSFTLSVSPVPAQLCSRFILHWLLFREIMSGPEVGKSFVQSGTSSSMPS